MKKDALYFICTNLLQSILWIFSIFDFKFPYRLCTNADKD